MRSQNYWNFKFLLASDEERFGDPLEKAGRLANPSVPFLAVGIASNVKDARRLYRSALDDQASSWRHAETTEIEDTFSLDDLDVLSVSELRGLRRAIALKLHPDRIQGDRIASFSYDMSEVNHRIDDAIRKKLGFGV